MLANISRYIVLFVCIASCSVVPDQPRQTPALEFVYGPESSRKLIVFVHGVLGDPRSWVNQSGKSWPELMAGDDAFREYRIATYRYDSPLFGRTSTLQEVSTRMLQQLEGKDVFRKYSEIYFITHGMGGLVTKRAPPDRARRIPASSQGSLLRSRRTTHCSERKAMPHPCISPSPLRAWNCSACANGSPKMICLFHWPETPRRRNWRKYRN